MARQYVTNESEAHDGGDYRQGVQCMRCRTVRWSLACFVGMSWRAEPGDSRMTVSSRLKERSANAEGTRLWRRPSCWYEKERWNWSGRSRKGDASERRRRGGLAAGGSQPASSRIHGDALRWRHRSVSIEVVWKRIRPRTTHRAEEGCRAPGRCGRTGLGHLSRYCSTDGQRAEIFNRRGRTHWSGRDGLVGSC